MVEPKLALKQKPWRGKLFSEWYLGEQLPKQQVYMSQLPISSIPFTTPEAERQRLVEAWKGKYRAGAGEERT